MYDSGHAGAVDGQVVINVPDNHDLPNLEDHRQRLIAAGWRAKVLWFMRFLVDGVVLTCLENSVDLTNDSRFEVVFLLYFGIFFVGMLFSSIREELLEDPPYEKTHAFECLASLAKFLYLLSLRGLHAVGVSSTGHVVVYAVFKSICSVLIKLLSAVASLRSLQDKLNTALDDHQVFSASY